MKNAETKAKELIRAFIENSDYISGTIDFLLQIVDPEDLLDAAPLMPVYLRRYLSDYEGNLTAETEQAVRSLLN